ncbi:MULTISPECIES: protease-like activity factor CPAF [Parachlamydia]|uniref:Chlamydia protease-like activity factor n=2 Tax=Parachlamydia acanthamoebae TaxID=83552 RepID=F8KXV5_PARAV|nr:protease-like activity factor CPAF [Parachlamydia acanthamoebae]EFB40431.1 putative chlamydial protease-like activity factor [Parachlamydia acanthamoebae str. Hall's coccus]KIA78604.1 Uncharacterized protein DB43_DS00310 [Parachlamydia acanthamoebae]CCB85685.1 chlamydia protease-like activity factor [Parachlamydia acanthamoebae UV-7]
MNIKYVINLYLVVVFFSCHALLASDSLLRQEMVEDLHFIRKNFQIKYVPADWKLLQFGWNLNQQFDNAEAEITSLSSPTLKDYHKILNKLFTSAADYHVNVSFYSTEMASLPFHLQGAEGRYFITWINEEKLPEECLDWSIGDEVIAFDGQDIHEFVQNLRRSEHDRHNEKTDQRFAERSLTLRAGMFAEDVPQGNVEVDLIHKKTGEQKSYVLTWTYHPEQVKEIPLPSLVARGISEKQPFFQRPYYKKMMLTPLYAKFNQPESRVVEDVHNLGARKSFVPPLGSIVWQSPPDSPFHAYICETPSRQRIGYIRIATYDGTDDEVVEFAKLIDYFNPRTQALVVDQVNNPGGSVFYSYGLLSLLTDQPLELPKYKMAITQEEVMEALETLDTLKEITNDEEAIDVCGPSLHGYAVSFELVQSVIQYFQFVLSEWEEGKYVTSPVHLLVNTIAPSPFVTYDKPMVVLVNEFDISCGDSFPCILQDNQRALIFGTRTAGAGGTVLGGGHPNRLGIAGYSYTASLLERHTDGTPIENLGVTPDVSYSLTPEDFQNGYKGYKAALQEAIDGLLKNTRPSSSACPLRDRH